jgi:hypothetical protein
LTLIALCEQRPKAFDYFTGAMASIRYAFKSGVCFILLWWDHFKKALRRIAARCDSCEWLSHFMSNRGHDRLRVQQLVIPLALQQRI